MLFHDALSVCELESVTSARYKGTADARMSISFKLLFFHNLEYTDQGDWWHVVAKRHTDLRQSVLK